MMGTIVPCCDRWRAWQGANCGLVIYLEPVICSHSGTSAPCDILSDQVGRIVSGAGAPIRLICFAVLSTADFDQSCTNGR